LEGWRGAPGWFFHIKLISVRQGQGKGKYTGAGVYPEKNRENYYQQPETGFEGGVPNELQGDSADRLLWRGYIFNNAGGNGSKYF